MRDVTVHLPPGSFVIIIGTNGSGKSTLLNAVAGIDTVHVPYKGGAPALVDIVRRAASASVHRWMDMVSGAGHDACQTAPVVPTAMLFIPCVGGISHAEQERITPEWAGAGAEVLLAAVLLADAELPVE